MPPTPLYTEMRVELLQNIHQNKLPRGAFKLFVDLSTNIFLKLLSIKKSF